MNEQTLAEFERRKDIYEDVFAYGTLNRDVEMHVWNGNHPPESNTIVHTAVAGTRVLITMYSRFGDLGIRDSNIESASHGYDARVDPSVLDDVVFV